MTDYLKIPEVARRLDVSEPTVRRMVKGGKLPSVFVGGAYRVSEEDLANYLEAAKVEPGDGSGKVQAPPQLEKPERGGAEERLTHWLEALQEQIMSRADKYGDEVEDENSPHFASANAATLWLAQVEDELAMWQDFSLKQTVPFLPERRTEGWRAILDTDVWGPWFDAISPLVVFDAVIRDAKRRIEGMQDKPDELAARRLEKATAAAKESRERLEEWRRSASG